jgi:predicted ATPase
MPRRPDRRAFGPGPYVLGAGLKPGLGPIPDSYPFLPVVHDLARFRTSGPVTIIAGENGSGKSTLIEALAIAAGFSSQGGTLSGELGRGSDRADRVLADAIELETGRYRARAGFFLRAESFFNVASVIDAKDLGEIYGGTALHEQSHGESFLALAANRFGADGLFIFDEPEAALSVTGQLAFIAMIKRAVALGSQFILATHSPILLSYPGATVYEASESGLALVDAEDTDPVRLTRSFLAAPEQFLRHLDQDEDLGLAASWPRHRAAVPA